MKRFSVGRATVAVFILSKQAVNPPQIAAHERDMTTNSSESGTARDPVVVYDVMREAATRLVGIYASRVTTGGVEDPAIKAIAVIYEEVEAIDWRNMDAQQIATEKFSSRFAELSEEHPTSSS